MKNNKKVFLALFCTLLVFTIIPSTTVALYSDSFLPEVDDYFFLKVTSRNNDTSAVTNFTIPDLNMNWMIEVTSVTDGPPTDNLSGKVYYDTSAALDRWQPTALFGPGEILFGQYNNVTGYTIDPTFESKFPLPLIAPTNITAAYNQTINASLLSHFQYTQIMDLSNMTPPEMAGLFPAGLAAMVMAWNGTNMWFNATESRWDPLGNQTGQVLLVAVYFGNGVLNYLRESWWDNNSISWNTMYKMVSPMWETIIGPIFEQNIPGSDVSGGGMGGIPGFPYGLVFIGLLVSIAIIYLKKPKNKIEI